MIPRPTDLTGHAEARGHVAVAGAVDHNARPVRLPSGLVFDQHAVYARAVLQHIGKIAVKENLDVRLAGHFVEQILHLLDVEIVHPARHQHALPRRVQPIDDLLHQSALVLIVEQRIDQSARPHAAQAAVLFNQQRARAGSSRCNRRADPRWAAAHDDHVVFARDRRSAFLANIVHRKSLSSLRFIAAIIISWLYNAVKILSLCRKNNRFMRAPERDVCYNASVLIFTSI